MVKVKNMHEKMRNLNTEIGTIKYSQTWIEEQIWVLCVGAWHLALYLENLCGERAARKKEEKKEEEE